MAHAYTVTPRYKHGGREAGLPYRGINEARYVIYEGLYTQPIRLLIVLEQWNADRRECLCDVRSRRDA